MDKSMPKDDTSLTLFWSSILSFANNYQLIDTQRLASNYLLIYNSNSFAPLIKVVGQAELGILRFWPMTQIGLEMAQIGVPHWPYRHLPCVRVYASKGNACLERGDHAESAHLHCCHLHLAFSSVCECGEAPEHPPNLFHSPSLSLPLLYFLLTPETAMQLGQAASMGAGAAALQLPAAAKPCTRGTGAQA